MNCPRCGQLMRLADGVVYKTHFCRACGVAIPGECNGCLQCEVARVAELGDSEGYIICHKEVG